MRSRTSRSRTFGAISRLLLQKPWHLFLFFMATVGQVLLTVYLPILIGQAVDASLETGFSSSFWLILW